MNLSDTFLDELRAITGDKNVITKGNRLDKNSRDCYWYSPVLKQQLDDKVADVIVQPDTVEQLIEVVACCVQARVPITPRGAGTGNYGQSIPIHGGVLVSTRNLTQILELTPDYAHVEAGVVLHTMEMAAREIGAELRFFPSTLPTATAGGFFAGGSAGPGSIKWGNLWDEGNILNATILTIEEIPQHFTVSDPDALQTLIHNCGLTAIITDLTFALAPREPWQQYIVAFDNFEDAIRMGYKLAFDEAQPTRLATPIDWPAPSFFKQLHRVDACPDGKPILLLHLTMDRPEVEALAAQMGGQVTWHSPEASLHRGSIELTDYAWNHTTLWAIKADKRWTYLQDEFDPERVYEQVRQRKARYGDDIIDHLEFSRADGILRPTGLTLVRYHSHEHLFELMDYCESIGILQYSPHTTYLDEEDTRWVSAHLVETKKKWDPYNLLNPGHLKALE